MKLIEIPQYGPMFRFTDANVYWSLHLLSDGRRMGRKRLAEAVGVGEGSMRRILESLRSLGYIDIKQTGITITPQGKMFLNKVPIKVINIDIKSSAAGMYQQGVIVSGVADKIVNGMEQRDAGIKSGAEGCTTMVIRDGRLLIPPDWDVDANSPEMAYDIRKTGLTQTDALIVGSAMDPYLAINAALTAALELI
jgi:predicted transcriptional regulator